MKTLEAFPENIHEEFLLQMGILFAKGIKKKVS